jgi:hypothetical protein
MITHQEESILSTFEDVSREIKWASELSTAATRENLIPQMSKAEAEAKRGIPVTRACGVHLANTLKALAAIKETGKDADFVSVAECKPHYGTHTIRLWRIPKQYGH